MTLVEAHALVDRLRIGWPHLSVMAIGHFVPPEDITPATPWAVSVFDSGSGRKSVLRSESDLPPLPKKKPPKRPHPAAEPVERTFFEIEGF